MGMFHRVLIRGLIAVLCAVGIGLPCRSVRAQGSDFNFDFSHKKEWPIGSTLPSPCPVRLALQISTATTLTPCYQPIGFRVLPAIGRTFPSDGTVTVRMQLSSYFEGRNDLVFTIPVRAGETVAESRVLAYTSSPGRNQTKIDGAWNGTYFDRLTARAFTPWYSGDYSISRLELLASDSWKPISGDVRIALASIENASFPVALVGDPTKGSLTGSESYCVADVAKIPHDWRQFAHFHHISATLENLKKLDEAGRRTIAQYVWCGGFLEVIGGADPADLEEILHADWNRVVAVPKSNERLYRAGFGSVLLTRSAVRDWDSIAHDSRICRLSTKLGDEYWNWLIPEVGKTPIWSFLGMVVLLVGIGAPAILLWSQRMQRRVWTILAIPVLSFVSVSSLFAYATIKDGWGAILRIRSITILDPDGKGAVWSRQTYFTSSIPGGKIRVDPQVEMIPLHANRSTPTVQYHDAMEEEHVFSGVLSLRQQRQVSITHGVQDLHLLQMGSRRDANTGMPVTTNSSGVTLVAVVCSDAHGRLFRAEKIPPGGVISWQETDPDDAVTWLRSFYNAQALLLPPDAPDSNAVSIFQRMSYSSPVWNSSTKFTRGFEEEDCWIESLTTWGKDSPQKFVAVVDQAPQLEKCLENAKETSSLHMVVGRWRPSETD